MSSYRDYNSMRRKQHSSSPGKTVEQRIEELEFYHGIQANFSINKNDTRFFHGFLGIDIKVNELYSKIQNDIEWDFFNCAEDEFERENERVNIQDHNDSQNSWTSKSHESKPVLIKYKSKFMYDFTDDTFLTNNISLGKEWSMVFVVSGEDSYNSYVMGTNEKKPAVISGWGRKKFEWFGTKKRIHIDSTYEMKLLIIMVKDGILTLHSQQEKIENRGEELPNNLILKTLGGLSLKKNSFVGKIATLGIVNRKLSINEIQLLKTWHRRNYF
jgi:hypothetical protein